MTRITTATMACVLPYWKLGSFFCALSVSASTVESKTVAITAGTPQPMAANHGLSFKTKHRLLVRKKYSEEASRAVHNREPNTPTDMKINCKYNCHVLSQHPRLDHRITPRHPMNYGEISEMVSSL